MRSKPRSSYSPPSYKVKRFWEQYVHEIIDSYYTYKAMTAAAAAAAALLHSTIAIRQLRLLSRTRLPSQ